MYVHVAFFSLRREGLFSPRDENSAAPQRPLNSAFLEVSVVGDLPGILRGAR